MIQTQDGIRLFLHEWGADAPRATIVLLHGYAEHAGRYGHVAKHFNQAGLSVVAADLRGHGRSQGPRGSVRRFQDYHLDVDALLGRVRSSALSEPIFVLGHSMGGLLLCDWLAVRGPSDVAGVILSSPFLGLALEVPWIKAVIGRGLSRFLPQARLPSGFSGRDLTRDQKMAQAYDQDPLNVRRVNARWFIETKKAMVRVQAAAGTLRSPLLLMYGADDRMASPAAAQLFFESVQMADRQIEGLPEHYHEIMNEPLVLRTAVLQKMTQWILERAA